MLILTQTELFRWARSRNWTSRNKRAEDVLRTLHRCVSMGVGLECNTLSKVWCVTVRIKNIKNCVLSAKWYKILRRVIEFFTLQNIFFHFIFFFISTSLQLSHQRPWHSIIKLARTSRFPVPACLESNYWAAIYAVWGCITISILRCQITHRASNALWQSYPTAQTAGN